VRLWHELGYVSSVGMNLDMWVVGINLDMLCTFHEIGYVGCWHKLGYVVYLAWYLARHLFLLYVKFFVPFVCLEAPY
jgi:hypothetical protein